MATPERREMAALFPDPLQLWRDALTRFETDFNTLANNSTKSQELVRSLHELSNASLTIQKLIEKGIYAYLRQVNLPSRKEILELAASLQRIEDKLDRLLPADAIGGSRPRPARTRQPPVAQAPGVAPVLVPEPSITSKRRAPRRGTKSAKPERRGPA
jgi:hypothetical protein